MEIIIEYPPNIETIAVVLPESKTRKGVLFAYAPNLYNPDDVKVGDEIRAHERCHIRQQGDDPDEWWKKYLEDPIFRFQQELEAHMVEARVLLRMQTIQDRTARRRIAAYEAKRLCSPLYGYKIRFEDAKKLIMQGLSK